MRNTIAILAPNYGPKDPIGYNSDFVVRYRNGGAHHDLSLKTLFTLAENDFNAPHPDTDIQVEEFPSAAGYYLTGLLRYNGFSTMISNKCDETAIQQIADQSPRVICISSTLLLTIDSLKDITDKIRKYMQDVIIVVGGTAIWKAYCAEQMGYTVKKDDPAGQSQGDPIVSFFSGNTPDIGVDVFVVAQHGGPTLLRLLKEIEKGSRGYLETIENLAIPDPSGGYKFTARKDEKVDYNHDYIRWDLVDNIPDHIPIRTSLGCPYRCAYCDFYTIFPKMHLRSRDGLLAELALIKKEISSKRPFTFLQLRDDNALATESRLQELCDILMASKIPLLGWLSFLRTAHINESNVRLLRKSGLRVAHIGVESGDPGQLERMNRKQNLAQIRSAIELLDDAGITVCMFFIAGFPGETSATLSNTAEFINNLPLKKSSSGYQIYPLVLPPLSTICRSDELKRRYSLKGHHHNWSHATMTSGEAVQASETLFRRVSNVPYWYKDESPLFNLRFTSHQRLQLFRMRKELTVQIMDDTALGERTSTLTKMVEIMGLSQKRPSADFVRNLSAGTHSV